MGGMSATVCLFCLFILIFHFFFIPVPIFFPFSTLVHLYSFLSFLLSPPSLFFSRPYSVIIARWACKASLIIVFSFSESCLWWVLCSSETRLFSILSLYHTNTGQLCLFSSDRKCVTFIFTQDTPLFQTHYRSLLLAISQDIFLGDFFFSLPQSWFIRLGWRMTLKMHKWFWNRCFDRF